MRQSTPSFITELPLRAGTHEQAILKKRFWAAKQQYNALLCETLKRLNALKRDPRYKEAHSLYKQEGRKKEAKAIFKALNETYGYREYDLYAFTKQWNTKKNHLSIGARLSQKIAKRVFSAVEEYRKKQIGKPRFKGMRGLSSVEDSSIEANLRLKNHIVHYLGLKLPLLIDPNDPIHWHGLNSRVKYVRLVRRNVNNRTRYFAQLICEGKPYIKDKNRTAKGTVGLDIGPQTIAIVSSDKKHAQLKVFADELRPNKTKKLKLERKIARRFRLGNPDAYKADAWIKKDKQWHKKQGKSIKGQYPTHRSKSLQKAMSKLADLRRKEAAHRKSQHGNLVNHILSIGDHIHTEKLSYKAFQKLYGSSVGLRAPGIFLEHLRRKAENAGGKVQEISTYKTKLSQACHCGRYKKKSLSKRWHTCVCGTKAQRDLYSAYLACFVENDKLIADQAQKAWSGMDSVLHTAMSQLKRSSSGPLPSSLGLSGSESVVCNVP